MSLCEGNSHLAHPILVHVFGGEISIPVRVVGFPWLSLHLVTVCDSHPILVQVCACDFHPSYPILVLVCMGFPSHPIPVWEWDFHLSHPILVIEFV